MAKCLISFGANIGDAKDAVQSAVQLLRERLAGSDTVELSRLYKTPPVGGPSGQASFVNAVAAVSTRSRVEEIWQIIRSIESDLGRERIRRWEARRIDLDILLYDDVRIWTPQLKIPHPRMCMRRFILVPASEVAGDWFDPVSQMTIGQLARRVVGRSGSLTLVAPKELNPMQVLENVSKTSSARIWDAAESLEGTELDFNQRRVAWIEANGELEASLQKIDGISSYTNLIVFWLPAAPNAPWEIQHGDRAVQLGLSDSAKDSQAKRLPIVGPCYLLATSDRELARHELTAALDAMDCEMSPIVELPVRQEP